MGAGKAASASNPSTVPRHAASGSFMLSSTKTANCAGAKGWWTVLA
jgi:hypothetical protein